MCEISVVSIIFHKLSYFKELHEKLWSDEFGPIYFIEEMKSIGKAI